MMQFYTYMLASQRNGTLYIGMTRDLVPGVGTQEPHRPRLHARS
jgi:predicted GIY-YIG superfamily endonuclease